jgi:hypothetical protein
MSATDPEQQAAADRARRIVAAVQSSASNGTDQGIPLATDREATADDIAPRTWTRSKRCGMSDTLCL